MSCSLTSSSIPMDAVPSPKWAGAVLQRHSLHPMQESLPCIHQTDPWVVFLPFSYLKTKQNSPLSWHVKCHFVCHQTISLQSHNDPCAKKRGKGCTPPNPDLWKSPGPAGSTLMLRNNGRWRGLGWGEDKEEGSIKFKGQKKCQSNTSTV